MSYERDEWETRKQKGKDCQSDISFGRGRGGGHRGERESTAVKQQGWSVAYVSLLLKTEEMQGKRIGILEGKGRQVSK